MPMASSPWKGARPPNPSLVGGLIFGGDPTLWFVLAIVAVMLLFWGLFPIAVAV